MFLVMMLKSSFREIVFCFLILLTIIWKERMIDKVFEEESLVMF